MVISTCPSCLKPIMPIKSPHHVLSRLLNPDQLMSYYRMNTHNLHLDQTENLKDRPDEKHNPKRNCAWQRKIKFLHRGRDCCHTSNYWKSEKDWKLLWNRSQKRVRAKQLGIEFPRISPQQQRLNAQYYFWNTPD